MASTPPTEHGGRLADARRRYEHAPAPFIDLSTGINPTPYPAPPIPPELWTRLPEPEDLAALQQTAAEAFGVAGAEMVVAAPGTQILISLLPLLLPARRVAVLGPTYSEHAVSWRLAGEAVQEIASLAQAANADILVLCNPNNPDGRRHDPARLHALAGSLAERGGLLVVDEAFADFDPALNLSPALPHPALLILRSFGKAYGLAGLRLGFALASPSLAARIRQAIGPWPISGPAAWIGRAALLDRVWLADQATHLAAAATRLDALLTRAGMKVVGGTALFRLAVAENAPQRFECLAEAGLLVRRFAAHPRWLRFGIPADETVWARLTTALI